MKIPLEREIHLNISADQAWPYLKDIPFLASCIPGARVTEVVGDGTFLGEITTKIGPVKSRFGGRMGIVSCNDATEEIRIQGTGSEQSAQSRAALDLTVRLLPKGPNDSVIQGKADFELMGKLASVGGRLIPAIANAIIDEFSANLQSKIGASGHQDKQHSRTAKIQEPPAAETASSLNIVKLIYHLLRRAFGRN